MIAINLIIYLRDLFVFIQIDKNNNASILTIE